MSPAPARQAAAASGRLGRGSRGATITRRILRGRGGFENPPNRLNPRPIKAIEQRGKCHRRQRHHPVHDRRPAERAVLQLLPDQHQATAVPDQDLHPVAALGAVDNDRTRKRILSEHFLRQGGEAVATSAEVNRPRRQQNARASRDGDHGRSTEARTARSTAVSWASSRPGTTHTTAPASLTSITGLADAAGAASRTGMASVTIGTKAGSAAWPPCIV